MAKNDLAKSDLARVDSHVITREEYAEAPELDDAFFDKAERHEGGVPVLRGRPPLGERAKKPVSIRLDPDVLDYFRNQGPGWQTAINTELREVMRTKAKTGS